ncbi:MAG: DUF2064 domain-containing protein [Chloroflexi bacterium]|nr:DUF2064 domain-containing protein [Chloroflexota bacterium]
MTDPGHRLATVVPVLDEGTAIGDLVGGLRRAGSCCVFVVDSGSRDGTPDVARAAGAIVVDEPRRGYGRACLTGAEAAAADHPAVAFLDGDGSCDPADLPGLVGALETADVVLGRRVVKRLEAGALPWHARAGNGLVAAILRRRTGRPVHDLSPFKALRRSALAVLDLDDEGFGWTVQLVARSLRATSLRVVEEPIGFRARRGGTSKVSGSLPASIAAGRRMLRNAVVETRPRPVVALMAKAPIAGQAKTRLASGIGETAAIEFWRACLSDLGGSLRAAARADGFTTVAVVPAPADIVPVAGLLGPGWEVIAQRRAGLGGAITDAVIDACQRGAPAVVVISGDNPTLPAALLAEAVAALRDAPAVLGPCPDGGYHLIGLRLAGSGRPSWLDRSRPGELGRQLDRVFDRTRLGGSGAFEATRRALIAEGLPPATLRPWADIDTADDLAGLAAAMLEVAADGAPATRTWLNGHADLLAPGPTRQKPPVSPPDERRIPTASASPKAN